MEETGLAPRNALHTHFRPLQATPLQLCIKATNFTAAWSVAWSNHAHDRLDEVTYSDWYKAVHNTIPIQKRIYHSQQSEGVHDVSAAGHVGTQTDTMCRHGAVMAPNSRSCWLAVSRKENDNVDITPHDTLHPSRTPNPRAARLASAMENYRGRKCLQTNRSHTDRQSRNVGIKPPYAA
jgi:hypothetical protein